jgi:hypothetical protein
MFGTRVLPFGTGLLAGHRTIETRLQIRLASHDLL